MILRYFKPLFALIKSKVAKISIHKKEKKILMLDFYLKFVDNLGVFELFTRLFTLKIIQILAFFKDSSIKFVG